MKSWPKDGVEFSVQASNPHFGEVPVGVDDLSSLHLKIKKDSK